MKYTSGPIYNEVRQSITNTVSASLFAEWNLNRYYRTVVDNTPSEDTDGYDVEFFPIESIVLPNRPTRGINKAVVGQSVAVANAYDSVPEARYYTASQDSKYKYWQSPVSSDTTAPFNFPVHTDTISVVRPRVEYVEEEDVAETPVPMTVKANKIQFIVESSYAYPDSYDVQIKTTTGGGWNTIASDLAIPNDGKVEIYYMGGDATDSANWSTDRADAAFSLNVLTDIYSVQLVVNSMAVTDPALSASFQGAYFNLIELGARIEADISADLVSESDEFTMSDLDEITPVGTVTANTGRLTLFDEDLKYDVSNTSSPIYGLIDKNVEFTFKYVYSGGEVQQFKLLSDVWNQDEATFEVALIDGSVQLMEQKPSALLFQNIRAQEAIWRLLDSVGFNNYVIEDLPNTASDTIDIFWTTGEDTVWEVLQDVARGTQIAIYFDSSGVLRIKTREAAFDDTQSVAWTALENKTGSNLADIITLEEDTAYEANKVTINYQPTGFSEKVGNIIPFEVVWEPEGVVTLRASEIIADLEVGDMLLKLQPKQASVWPFSGIVQVEGEWIRYKGKKYTYYDETDTRQVATINSIEEKDALDEQTNSDFKHLNNYTGELVLTERGLWNTEELDHFVEPTGWTKRRVNNYVNPGDSPAKGYSHNKSTSTVTLQSGSNRGMNSYFYVYRGNTVDQGWRRIGTRMKIDRSGHKHKTAGIFFNSDGVVGEGYYVELMATSRMNGKMRQTRNELILYSQKSDGSKKIFGGEKIVSRDDSKNHSGGSTTKVDIGARLAVVGGRYVEIDVYFNESGGDHHFKIFANGKLAIDTTIPNGSSWKHAWVSRFGMYVRGNTKATFDYIYGLSRTEQLYDDEETFFDRIQGGYVGDQWDRDYVYEVRTARRKVKKKWTKYQQRYKQRFFDEFGPIAHEVREFDVKFDTDGLPVLQSKLFHTNDTQAVVTEYVHYVDKAKFIMANTSREHAILNGEDTLTAKGEATIDQKLFVYGRPVIQKDSVQVEKEDTWGIRRRGEISLEFQSRWIQNEAAAEALGNWLTTHWTRSDSLVTLEIFGNPLIEIVDIVAIEYMDMTASTHKYYVVGIRNEYQNGIQTTLTLKRVSI